MSSRKQLQRTSHKTRRSNTYDAARTPPCTVAVTLRDYQRTVANTLLYKQRSLLFVAGTGSGKTIAFIVTGVCLLTHGLVERVVIVTPTGVHTQFARVVHDLVPSKYQSVFKMHTHHKFFHSTTNFAKHLRNAFLVVDEAHAMSTPIVKIRGTNEIGSGKMAYEATRAAQLASRVLLLTATPMKNNPAEMFNLLCMVQQIPYEQFYKNVSSQREALTTLYREFMRAGNEYLLCRKRKQNVLVQAYTDTMRPLVQFASTSSEGFPTVYTRIKRLRICIGKPSASMVLWIICA